MDDETHEPRDGDPTATGERTRSGSDLETVAGESPVAPGFPDGVSGYSVVGVIGEGGMGVVLEAEQQEPRRRVALKMIRGGSFASERARTMFQREVTTLARLKHPGIASIFASGTTDDGQPFLAMELVTGVDLNRYLAARSGPQDREEIAFRLRLVRKIALAVHYAHQRGVIHRDLKPGNILVSTELSDALGLPEIKILDFGLARLTDDEDAAGRTTIGAIQGTLGYMSPEQARGNPDEIDTRTDVYALGVILYEALTGKRPHALARASFVDAVRAITERPPRPLRDAWPDGADRLDPDVDTIVHTALAADVDRRYPSADALARDIGRFLTAEPILARPPSTVYQLRKFAQRNRTLVAGIAATVLVLIAGIVVSTVLGLSEARQRRAAEEARSDLEQVVSFQAKTLRDVDPEVTGRRLMAAIGRQFEGAGPDERDLLERLGHRVNPTDLARVVLDENILAPAADAAAREFSDQPRIESRLQVTLADTYRSLGLFDRAAERLELAVDLGSTHFGPRAPETLEAKADLVRIDTLREGDRVDLDGFDELIGTQGAVLGPDHPRTLGTRYDRASALYKRGDLAGALEGYVDVHEAQVVALGADHPDTIQTLSAIGTVQVGQGNYEAAASAMERVLEARTRILGPEDEWTVTATTNLAALRTRQGRYDEAERLYLDALETLRTRHGDEYPRTLRVANNLGVLYTRTGRHEQAYELAAETLAIRRRVLGRAHPETMTSMNNVAVLLTDLGRYDEAAALLDEILELDERYARGTVQHAIHLHTYAELLIEREDWADARRRMAAALELYRSAGHAFLGGALVQAAGIEARAGRPDAAFALLREAVERGAGDAIRRDDPALASIRDDPRFDALGIATDGG